MSADSVANSASKRSSGQQKLTRCIPWASRPEYVREVNIISHEHREKTGKPAGFNWHTDQSFRDKPSALTMLYGVEIPETQLEPRRARVLKQIDRCAPLANALTKAVVQKVGTEPLSSVLDFAADKFAEARRSPEAAEGLRAFAEKRPPKWAVE